MERRDLYFLYVNMNSIVELGLQQLAERILSMPPQEPEQLSQEELEARAKASLENLDLSALDGLNFDFFSRPADAAAGDVPPADWTPPPDLAARAGTPEEPLNIGAYLARAYAQEAVIRPRTDAHFEKVDPKRLRALLARMPRELPSLLQPLSADDMERWLARYHDEDPALHELATEIRALDTPLER